MTTLKENLITNTCKDLFGSIYKSLGDEVRHIINNRILEYQINLYKSLYRVKTIFHRTEVVFTDIYEPVCLFDMDENQISLDDIFKDGKRIIILGEAGLGKSSFVRNFILNHIDKGGRYPILLELRDFNDKSIDLLDYIKNEILKFENISDSERIQQRFLETGKFCIIFEGYDELSKERKNEIIKQIKRITNRFPNNEYVITSRPYTGIEYFENFTNYNLCDLLPDQIESFINRQFSKQKKSDLPAKIIASIKEERNKHYLHYLRNPLLLSLFLLTFDEHAGLPQRQSEFFSDIFETLIHTHNSLSKMGFERKLDTGLDKQSLETVLQSFSFLSFFDETYVFSHDYFESKINIIKEKEGLKFKVTDLQNDLVVAIGILTKEGPKLLFPHKTLHEYFTIAHIIKLPKELKIRVYKKLKSIFLNKTKVGELNNFYILLMEMDFCDSTDYFLIPLLNELRKDNQVRLSSSKDNEEERFFRSLDMLRLFNFEDFLLNELFERGTYLHKKMSLILKYDAEYNDLKSEIKKQNRKLKAIHSEQNYLEKVIPTLEDKISYLEKLEEISVVEEEVRNMIISFDEEKDLKQKEKKKLVDSIKESVVSFNKEVELYLDVKVPELELAVKNRRRSDEDLVDLI